MKQPTQSLNKVSSWVIFKIGEDKPICEVWSLEGLNLEEYKAVPILDYLQVLNGGTP